MKSGSFDFSYQDGKDTRHVTFARGEKGLTITLAGFGWGKNRTYDDVSAGWKEQEGVLNVTGEVRYLGRHPFEFRIDCGRDAVTFSIDRDPAKTIPVSADQCARATTFVHDCIVKS